MGISERKHAEAMGETLRLLGITKDVSDGFVEQASEKSLSEIQVAGFILSYRAVAQFLEDDMNNSRSADVRLEAFDGVMRDMEEPIRRVVFDYLESRVQSMLFRRPNDDSERVTDEDDD
jgi:hypothetical protein